MGNTFTFQVMTTLAAAIILSQPVLADPESDRIAFVAFYKARFPNILLADFANGIYAIDANARAQWLEIETFPPYEFVVDKGAALWEEISSDGKTYAACFSRKKEDIRPAYPRFDNVSGEVVTLAKAINDCRASRELPAFSYKEDEITAITAFLAFEARGKKLDIRVPDDDPRALDAYENGKRFYYTKRGQLNFSCSDCHGISSGQHIRADRLSAGLGHPTHFPVYRSKTGGMVSLHQRFSGCVRDIRARPFVLQSIEFRNLEYFLTYMSNGFEFNGPGSRK